MMMMMMMVSSANKKYQMEIVFKFATVTNISIMKKK